MGWLSGWTYRKKITISASADQTTWVASTAYSLGTVVRPITPNGFWYQCETAGTSGSSAPTWPTTDQSTVTDGTVTWRAKRYYQVPLLIGESSGASGFNFHLEGKSASFPSGENQGGDLRFTASDGLTLLDFWVESVSGTTPNRLAKVWVEVPGDLSQKDICCYFGNASATNASDPNATYVYYQDFEIDTVGQPPSKFLTTTNLQVYSDTVQGAKALKNIGDLSNPLMDMPDMADLCLDGKIKYTSGTDIRLSYIVRFVDANNVISVGDIYGNNYLDIYECVAGTWYRRTYAAFTWGTGWHNIQIKACGDDINVLLDSTPLSYGTLSITSAGKCGVTAWASCYAAWDFIRIRNYTANEPAFSSAGALETLNLGAMLLMFLS